LEPSLSDGERRPRVRLPPLGGTFKTAVRPGL
jgi:hypothetical protein